MNPNRRMDSDAKQRNPSGNRKINSKPAPGIQTVMSEAASGFRPPRTHHRRTANRRMDSGAKQRNPSGDRKINTQPASYSQIAMSEAASGFQPPSNRYAGETQTGGWIAARSNAIRRAIARSTPNPRQTFRPPCRKPQADSNLHERTTEEPHTGGWIAARSNAIRRAIARSTPNPRQAVRPSCRKPQADSNRHQTHQRRTANRRMDSGAKQRNPSGNRKINPKPAPDRQTAMSEAASGFQPPSNRYAGETQTGGWIAARSNAIRRAIARSTPNPRQAIRSPCRKPRADSNLHKHTAAEPPTGGWIAAQSNAIRRAIARSTPNPAPSNPPFNPHPRRCTDTPAAKVSLTLRSSPNMVRANNFSSKLLACCMR